MNSTPMPINVAIDSANCLYSFVEVETAIKKIAININETHHTHKSTTEKSSPVVVLTVMSGGMIFAGMLLPHLNFLIEVDYIHATRYGANQTGGQFSLLAEPKIDLDNKTVLLLDDIYDDGITLERVSQYCKDRGAKEVQSAVLIYKNKIRNKKQIAPPNFTALTVPDEFVFGMGMDADGLYRNVPGIYYFPK